VLGFAPVLPVCRCVCHAAGGGAGSPLPSSKLQEPVATLYPDLAQPAVHQALALKRALHLAATLSP
jgi:hypothetical protein